MQIKITLEPGEFETYKDKVKTINMVNVVQGLNDMAKRIGASQVSTEFTYGETPTPHLEIE